MPLPALATTEQLATLLQRRFEANEMAYVRMILELASTRVRAFAGETWVDEEGDLADDIDDAIGAVTLLVAKRAIDNPRSVITQGAGPFSETIREDAAELLYLTDTEEQMIAATLETPSPGLAVLSTTRGDIETASVRSCDGYAFTVEDLDDWDGFT